MTVRLDMFTMPFHHPAHDYADLLEEDQEAIVLADRLGFSEAFVGEHFSSWSEGPLRDSPDVGPGLGPAQALAPLDGAARERGDAAIRASTRRDTSEVRS